MEAGELRERIWEELARTHSCGYPLPPHGRYPNFRGAARAARRLLGHPELRLAPSLVVGAERVLAPLRKQALEQGKVLYVPHLEKAGWSWKLTDPAAARLSAMPRLGEPVQRFEAAGAVLASVAVDRRGARLGKGFGWGANGVELPTYTLAHRRMLLGELGVPADSTVRLIALEDEVLQLPALHWGP